MTCFTWRVLLVCGTNVSFSDFAIDSNNSITIEVRFCFDLSDFNRLEFRYLVTKQEEIVRSKTNVLYGKPIADRLLNQCQVECREFKEKYHRRPQLVAILVGGNESSKLYVRNKQRVAERVGCS